MFTRGWGLTLNFAHVLVRAPIERPGYLPTDRKIPHRPRKCSKFFVTQNSSKRETKLLRKPFLCISVFLVSSASIGGRCWQWQRCKWCTVNLHPSVLEGERVNVHASRRQMFPGSEDGLVKAHDSGYHLVCYVDQQSSRDLTSCFFERLPIFAINHEVLSALTWARVLPLSTHLFRKEATAQQHCNVGVLPAHGAPKPRSCR